MRGVGIEARLELEQHVAAALERGRAHLLDVRDRLQLRLERLQDQPLGVLRADAALRDVDIDDRDRDVRLGLLRDRDIGDEARHQQEEQDGDRQPRVIDRVVDRIAHGFDLVWSVYELEISAAAGVAAASTGSTFWPSFTKSWPWTMTFGAVRRPATQISSRASSTMLDRHGGDHAVGADGADAELALGGEGQGRARHARGGDRRELELDLGGDAVGDRVVGVRQQHFDAIGARAFASPSAR